MPNWMFWLRWGLVLPTALSAFYVTTAMPGRQRNVLQYKARSGKPSFSLLFQTLFQ